jgi:TRAP-type transport system periplasmic protein
VGNKVRETKRGLDRKTDLSVRKLEFRTSTNKITCETFLSNMQHSKKEAIVKKSFLAVGIALSMVILFISLTPARAASEKPIVLRFSSLLPPTNHLMPEVYDEWAKELEKRTNGRVKVQMFPGATLGPANVQYDLVTRGIADIAIHVVGYSPGRFPLSAVLELPIFIPSAKVGSRVMWELYEKYLKAEYSDVHLLALSVNAIEGIHTTKKPIRTAADMKGLRMRSSGPQAAAALRAWGASPLNIPATETYDAMQKGMADGMIINGTGLKDFKFNDFLKCHTLLSIRSPVVPVVMNLKTWNSLPPDIQKIIDEMSGRRLSMMHGEAEDKAGAAGIEEAKKLGHTIITPSQSEKQTFQDMVKPVNDEWIAEMEKKGLPGKKVFQDAQSLMEKYSRE